MNNNYITLTPLKYNEFNLSYQQRICAILMESSGVAMSAFSKEIEYIIFIIFNFFDTNGPQNAMLEINEELRENNMDTIDMINKINIHIFFENTDTYGEYLPNETKIINNIEIDEITIQFVVDILKWQNQKALISSLLYHELNHAIDDINRIKKKLPSLMSILTDPTATVDYIKVTKHITNDNMSLPYVIYRLFVDTELNALIAQLYGELQVLQPSQHNYSIVIKQCETYDIYNVCKQFYDNIICKTDNWISEAKMYFPKKQNITNNKFKKWFIQQYEERLKTLWYKLWKAGYYYFNN